MGGKVGMVCQSINQLQRMTALQNVRGAPEQVVGVGPEEGRGRAADLEELVGLDNKRDDYPSQLAGGQQ
ncbi:ectoine/hydroxyectoine ABC transporter ATP-binding protein EhuA, partial [Pseudomonas ogarae]